MKYKNTEVYGDINNQEAFEKAADQVLTIIQKWWGDECVSLTIEDDAIIGSTRGKHKVRVIIE